MRPDQRTKIAADIYEIFADRFAELPQVKEDDEQAYTRVLEEIEQYIAEKIG